MRVEAYAHAAFTPALADSELLPGLDHPRPSAGLDYLVIVRLTRHGGSGYASSHMLGVLRHHVLHNVSDAPSLEQPVYIATHIRQRDAQTIGRGTFVPLSFSPGEAFQFDWSEDWAGHRPIPPPAGTDDL